MRALALAVLLLLALPGVAAAQVEDPANALKSDPVYVDPGAELADQVDAAALRARIGTAPIYVAVLPASAVEDSPARTLIALRKAVGENGTYALAVGDEFRTLSDSFDAADPGDAARAANPDDLQAALLAFVDTARREGADSRSGSGSGSGAGGVLAAIFAVAVLLAVLAGGVFLIAGRRRQRRERAERDEFVRENLDEDFVRLGDAIRTLELDVTLAPSDSATKADYDHAVEAYDRANDLNRKGQPEAANRALDDGLAAIATARERLAGRR
jgi:hypothetical protein